MHVNVNKPKSRAARTVYGPIFLPFLCDYCQLFSFSYQDANKTGSNYAIIGCNLSKKHKSALNKTQSGKSNYVDHKCYVIIWLEHVLYDFKYTMKIYLADIIYLLGESSPSIFPLWFMHI